MFNFKKSQRLLKKSDFDFVFKRAKKSATPEFTLLYQHNGLSHARIGLAISKKMVAKAHDRNRIKRMVRETFRLCKLPPIDIIVLARPGVLKLDNSMLKSKLEKAWKKLSESCET